MTLDEYLIARGMTEAAFGELLDPPEPQWRISRWRLGKVIPSDADIRRVQHATGGKVRAADFESMTPINPGKRGPHRIRTISVRNIYMAYRKGQPAPETASLDRDECCATALGLKRADWVQAERKGIEVRLVRRLSPAFRDRLLRHELAARTAAATGKGKRKDDDDDG